MRAVVQHRIFTSETGIGEVLRPGGPGLPPPISEVAVAFLQAVYRAPSFTVERVAEVTSCRSPRSAIGVDEGTSLAVAPWMANAGAHQQASALYGEAVGSIVEHPHLEVLGVSPRVAMVSEAANKKEWPD